jgi:hypothetical protein
LSDDPSLLTNFGKPIIAAAPEGGKQQTKQQKTQGQQGEKKPKEQKQPQKPKPAEEKKT